METESAIAPPAALADLHARLGEAGALAVAVSGGVDSMTLAVVAARRAGGQVQVFHAVSPAVPPEATARVERYAARERWALTVVDAGEFRDRRYRANPVDRCYFCKQSLYATLSGRTRATLVSGTNADDLGDFRPGLAAAREHDVRHPYVEAGIDKRGVRAIARSLGLDDLAELPAAPCLSSRVETGIAIEAPALAAVNEVERAIAARLRPATVRCRLRREAVVIELDAAALDALDDAEAERIAAHARAAFGAAGVDRHVRFAAYRMGSAFLRGAGAG